MKKPLNKFFPDIAKEWHPTKNKDITPDTIGYASHKKIWWKCEQGHEWQTKVSHRTMDGTGCPDCPKIRVNEKNRLSTNYPELSTEWHPTKNGIITPDDVSFGLKSKVWWICEKGHEWDASISDRKRGRGCPYCAGKRVCYENSLANLFPKIALEWHPTKNNLLTPKDVTIGSGKIVWWVCKNGHEWPTIVKNRTKGHGCPYCSGQKVCNDNCLSTLFPEIAKEWHPTKNKDLTPNMVTTGTDKVVWWRCKKKGHSWDTSVQKRVKGSGCPYCSGQKTCEDNCIATLLPNLAKEWHPIKNNNLTPYMVTTSSNKRIWWLCKKGHSWEDTVNHRSSGRGCPKCNPQTSFPEQAIFFYLTKLFKVCENRKNIIIEDKKLEADIFIPELKLVIEYDGYYFHKDKYENDKNKISLFHKNGYEIINIRENGLQKVNDKFEILVKKSKYDEPLENGIKQLINILKKNFSVSKKITVDIKKDKMEIINAYNKPVKENNIAQLFPELVKEWNYRKNGNLLPENFTKGSGQRVWWICLKGHEWESTIYNRVKHRRCPDCYRNEKKRGQ